MEWELRIIGFASVGANGKVEDKVMFETYYIVGEWILSVSIITLILSLREIDFIQQLIIEIDADERFVPIHTPDVELFCPMWIFLRKMAERYDC